MDIESERNIDRERERHGERQTETYREWERNRDRKKERKKARSKATRWHSAHFPLSLLSHLPVFHLSSINLDLHEWVVRGRRQASSRPLAAPSRYDCHWPKSLGSEPNWGSMSGLMIKACEVGCLRETLDSRVFQNQRIIWRHPRNSPHKMRGSSHSKWLLSYIWVTFVPLSSHF